MAGKRIIELEQIADENITQSSVLPIENSASTNKISLLQLQDYFTGNLDFLPLSGGTMSGDIETSNGYSVNTELKAFYDSCEGKSSSTPTLDCNLVLTNCSRSIRAEDNVLNAPVNPLNGTLHTVMFASEGAGTQTCQAMNSESVWIRNRSSGVWSTWRKLLEVGKEYQPKPSQISQITLGVGGAWVNPSPEDAFVTVFSGRLASGTSAIDMFVYINGLQVSNNVMDLGASNTAGVTTSVVVPPNNTLTFTNALNGVDSTVLLTIWKK